MKKGAIIFVLIVLACSCDKSNVENENNATINRIQKICEMNYDDLLTNFGSECLSVSPFSIVGDKVNESLYELEKLVRTEKIKNEDLRNSIIGIIESKLPREFTKLSDEGYTEIESLCYSFISQSILMDDITTLNFRLSCIEDLILKTKCFNLEAQTRLLVYCSVLKGISNYLYQLSSERKQESWDQCFRRKQQQILDSGFFAKMACVIDWPVCLGVMAADCVLETRS
ncbi:MAG: hypothetical protein GT597_08380 [Bacteroidales bacterium]|jgi:hypothetical protein|nr:hypothetical protein [Bacteroidales bacterium]